MNTPNEQTSEQQHTLKPCPFCGGYAELTSRFDAKCTACGAEINSQTPELDWNTRAPGRNPSVLPEVVAALEEMEFLVDGEADVDDGQPNLAMKIQMAIEGPLSKLKGPQPALELKPLTGVWITRCCACGKEYVNGCGSTECCGALQEVIPMSAEWQRRIVKAMEPVPEHRPEEKSAFDRVSILELVAHKEALVKQLAERDAEIARLKHECTTKPRVCDQDEIARLKDSIEYGKSLLGKRVDQVGALKRQLAEAAKCAQMRAALYSLVSEIRAYQSPECDDQDSPIASDLALADKALALSPSEALLKEHEKAYKLGWATRDTWSDQVSPAQMEDDWQASQFSQLTEGAKP